MTRILITGVGSHNLGDYLTRYYLNFKNYDVFYTYRSNKMDGLENAKGYFVDLIQDQGELSKCIEECQPHVIINCIAMARPALCEANPEDTFMVNVPSKLLDCVQNKRILIIHLSTDHVYDGTLKIGESYSDEATPNPINTYGKSKTESERIMAPHESVCLRSSMIYGRVPNGARTNFFTQFADENLKSGKKTSFFTDEIRSPVLNLDIARVTKALADKVTKIGLESPNRVDAAGLKRVYNMGGPSVLSRYEMAMEICKYRKYDANALIIPASASSAGRTVATPLNTAMDSHAIYSHTGVHPTSFSEGVKYLFSDHVDTI